MATVDPTTIAAPTMRYATGVALVLLAGALWSTMGIGIRLIEQANVWQILFYRSCALAAFLFVLISLRSGGRPLRTIHRAGRAGVVGGLGLVFAFAGGIYAIQTTTVANAMFLFAAAPFVAAVLGWVLLRESVRHATWIAMAFATLGILIMVANGIAAGRLAGNLSALLSACGFAVFTIALRWGRLEDMFPAVFLAGVFALMTGAFVCFTGGYGFDLPPRDIAIAVALGVFQVGAGLAVFTLGSRVVPAAELALLSMTEVLLAPLWVWWLLGEAVSAATLGGGAILLVALAGNALSGARRKPVPVI